MSDQGSNEAASSKPDAGPTKEQLQDRVTELERERADYRDRVAVRKARRQWLLGRLRTLLLGGSLAEAIDRILQRIASKELPETIELATVIDGVLRRLVRVGLAGLLITLLPSGFLIWQNVLLGAQVEVTVEQFETETRLRLLQRKTELIRILWDTETVEVRRADGWGSTRGVVPIASKTHRREASLEYVGVLEELEEDVSFVGARLDGIRWTSAWGDTMGEHLRHAKLVDANFGKAELEGAKLDHADLTSANLHGAKLTGAELVGAILTDAKLTEAVLKEVLAKDAMLVGVKAGHANFHKAKLPGANLRGADLSNANLRDANLAGAKLVDADLTGADLTGAILTGAILKGATYSLQTKWPDPGFDPSAPRHELILVNSAKE